MGPIEQTILTVLFLIGSGIILFLLATLAFGLWP